MNDMLREYERVNDDNRWQDRAMPRNFTVGWRPGNLSKRELAAHKGTNFEPVIRKVLLKQSKNKSTP